MARDLDDYGPVPTPQPPPASPSWEKLGEPMTLRLGGVLGGPLIDFEITVEMLRAVAATFSATVPVEPMGATFTTTSHGTIDRNGLRCLGLVDRVEMRGDEMWGFVRWTGQCPLHGIAAMLEIERRDPETGASAPARLRGAIVRPAVGGVLSCPDVS